MKLWRPRLSLKGCLIVGLVAPMLCYCANCGIFYISVRMAYTKWQSSQPDRYSVTVNYGDFGRLHEKREETVENGVLLESPDRRPALDRAFLTAQRCAISPIGFLVCEVEYDLHYGYPTRIRVNDLDFGSFTEVVDFRPE